jgi:hypothetical protein
MIKSPNEWRNFIEDSTPGSNKQMPGSFAKILTKEEKAHQKKMLEAVKKSQSPKPESTKKLEKEPSRVDIGEIMSADISSEEEAAASEHSLNDSEFNRRQRGTSTPEPEQHSDEDEDQFIKRRNFVEEDEFVSKHVINGLPEFNEFAIVDEEFEITEEREMLIIAIKKELIRFCILRIFRPDLLVDQLKRIVAIYFGEMFVKDQQVTYPEVRRLTTKLDINLMLISKNMDAQDEILRMRQVLRVVKPLVYKNLNTKTLKQLPKLLAQCAIRGEWLLLDNVDQQSIYFSKLLSLFKHMFNLSEENRMKAEKAERKAKKAMVGSSVTFRNANRGKGIGLDEDEPMILEDEEVPEEEKAAMSENEISFEFPRTHKFAIHDSFRLWLSTRQGHLMPVILL